MYIIFKIDSFRHLVIVHPKTVIYVIISSPSCYSKRGTQKKISFWKSEISSVVLDTTDYHCIDKSSWKIFEYIYFKFGKTSGWVNDNIFLFGWSIPLTALFNYKFKQVLDDPECKKKQQKYKQNAQLNIHYKQEIPYFVHPKL